jgi:hypothetical protein
MIVGSVRTATELCWYHLVSQNVVAKDLVPTGGWNLTKYIGYTTVHASFVFFRYVSIDISCGQWYIALLQQFILSHFDVLLPLRTYVVHVDGT